VHPRKESTTASALRERRNCAAEAAAEVDLGQKKSACYKLNKKGQQQGTVGVRGHSTRGKEWDYVPFHSWWKKRDRGSETLTERRDWGRISTTTTIGNERDRKSQQEGNVASQGINKGKGVGLTKGERLLSGELV